MPKQKNNKKANYTVSDHCNGTHFFNPGINSYKSIKSVWNLFFELRKENSWPDFVENKATPIIADKLEQDETYITYINHASHLIQLSGINIITDPIFSKRAGPLSLIGPKRVRKPGIELHNLPKIDIVLISHNHYDHMDLAALKKLESMFKPLFIVPLGNKKYLKEKIFSQVIELDWWKTYQTNDNHIITLVPAQHWSMRTPKDSHTALWGGFWIRYKTLNIYFAGDTGYSTYFKDIYEKMGAPDISILPIGSYEPRWFMKDLHMNPDEAVLASIDLQSHINLATHHQTFRLSLEKINDPVITLKRRLKVHGLTDKDFLAPETGETVIYRQSTRTPK